MIFGKLPVNSTFLHVGFEPQFQGIFKQDFGCNFLFSYFTCVNAFALQNRVLQKNQDLKNEKYHSMTQNFLSNDSF